MWTPIETPSFKQIFSFSMNENFPLELKYRKNSKHLTYWTSRGLQIINEICIWYNAHHGKNPIFCIPSYICYEVPEILLAKNVEILYYNLDESFNVDMNSIPPNCDFFIAVHFFGIPSDLSKLKKWCTKRGAVLIEDATHVPFPNGTIGNHGEICLYSPYKHFPVPEGACAVFDEHFLDKNPSLKKRFEKIHSHNSLPIKWILKKTIQRLFKINRKNLLDNFNLDPARSSIFISDRGIAQYSLNILSKYTNNDLDNIHSSRLKNCATWKYLFSLMNLKIIDSQFAEIPMSYIVRTTKENASELFDLFNTLGVYPSTWPTLPDSKNQFSENAEALRKSIILLPTHQGIKTKDFLPLFHYIEKESNDVIELEKFIGSNEDWNQILSKTTSPNILQSYTFNQARSEQSNKYIIKIRSKIVGIAIVRQKRIGPFKIHFINRGPLLIDDNPVIYVKVIKKLRDQHNLLLVSPEISDKAVVQSYFRQNNFIKLPIAAHHSSRIDLTNDIAQIRSRLDSKWRNLLKKGESLNPEIIVSNQKNDYMIFLEMYKNFVSEKNFQGLSYNLLEKYFDCCDLKNLPTVLMLKQQENIVSAILIAQYAQEGLYLAGVNSEEGRKVCGNYVLLWKAIDHLKAQGLKTFDLGGFDDINTPQITHFKRQMGGLEYKLTGTYLVFK